MTVHDPQHELADALAACVIAADLALAEASIEDSARLDDALDLLSEAAASVTRLRAELP